MSGDSMTIETTFEDFEALRMESYIRRRLVPLIACEGAAVPKWVHTLTELANGGKLRSFMDIYSEHIPTDAPGNCHDVAMALMANLIKVNAAKGWVWATGNADFLHGRGMHSWLEHDGWVVDTMRNRCLVMRRRDYYSFMGIQTATYRNERKSRRYLANLFRKDDRRRLRTHRQKLLTRRDAFQDSPGAITQRG